MIRSLSFAAALLASCACVHADPVLKAEVTVSGALVTVGDMFDDAGTLGPAALFRAPAPGTAGTVDLAAIRTAAQRVGLADFADNGLTSVRVARAGVTVDADLLSGLIAEDLSKRGIMAEGVTADTSFDRPLGELVADATAQPVSILALRYLPGTGGFTAKFLLAGQDRPLDVSGTIELMIEAPHLASALPEGAILKSEDIEMRRVPLRFAETSTFATPDQLVGKALQHQSRAGIMLKPSDVAEPKLISRNDLVTVYFKSGPLTLTVKGQALNDASLGQQVSVLNGMSKKVVRGVAKGDGAVEITGIPSAMASL